MTIPSKAWWAVLAVVPAGLVSALVLDGGQARREVILPAGTSIVAALQSEVSTARSRPGESVELRTVRPLPVEGEAPVPADVIVRGQVSEAEGGGRMGRAPKLGLTFRELEIDGERYPIQARVYFAAIGTGVAAATEGDHLVLRAGHQITVTLTGPVRVVFRPEPAAPEPPR
jgi:hypothetical protein